MSAADGLLKRQAQPHVGGATRVLQRPADGFKDRFSCLRGPYIAHYADSSMSNVVSFTVLRPTTRVARADGIAQATDGVLPPQPAVLKVWESPEAHRASGKAVVSPTGFRLEAPTFIALGSVPELHRWLTAIDGVLRVMRGDYALPRPPSAVPRLICSGFSHDTVSLSWAPVPVSRPAERVLSFVVEFWRLRHGDVVALPDSSEDLHALEVCNPWLPAADGARGGAAATESGAVAALGLADDARIPGLSGGDVVCCTVAKLRPRAKYAFRIRAVNVAGPGLAGGDEGFAVALEKSERASACVAAGDAGDGGKKSHAATSHSDGIVIATTLGPPSVALPAPLLCQPGTHELCAAWPLPVLPSDDSPCTGFFVHVVEAAVADDVQVGKAVGEAGGVATTANHSAHHVPLPQSGTSRAAAAAAADDAREDATIDGKAHLLTSHGHPLLALSASPERDSVLPLWPVSLLGAPPGLVLRVKDATATRVLVSGLRPGTLYTARIVVLSRAGAADLSLNRRLPSCSAPLLTTPIAQALARGRRSALRSTRWGR